MWYKMPGKIMCKIIIGTAIFLFIPFLHFKSVNRPYVGYKVKVPSIACSLFCGILNSLGYLLHPTLKVLRGVSQELNLIRVNTLKAIKTSQIRACLQQAAAVFAASGGSVWFVRGHQMKHLASICVLGVCGLPASRPPSVRLEGFSCSSRRQKDIWHPDTS